VAAACSAGGTRAAGGDAPEAASASFAPVQFAYRAYASGARLTLVNAAHTNRTELYSSTQPLDSARTKVAPDEVVDEMVLYFREQGFFAQARPGRAPESAPPGVKQALEVETAEGPVHALLGEGAKPDEVRCFLTCVKAFLDLYNNTVQMQSVDRAPDWQVRPSTTPRKGG
jgi:hypothetical protein